MQQNLGDYRVIKKIGQGSLGTVLLVEHRFIKKHYVLKILPEELSQDSQFLKAFDEEISKISQLDHQNIVKIHNVSFAEGMYFLVSDSITDAAGDSVNLGQYMANKKESLKEDELLSITRQIAEALDYAHIKGQIVHRALKLSNVLVSKGKDRIEIFLSDFGLAKIIGPGKILYRTLKNVSEALNILPTEAQAERYFPFPTEAESLSSLSRSFLQGFAFMAPEQKRGESATVHVDSYAFGVLVYFLIAGVFPEGAFPMPSRIAPHYTGNWDEIIAQCLQPDPLSRPTQLCPLFEKRRQETKSTAFTFEPHQEVLYEKNEKESASTIERLKEKLLHGVGASKEKIAATASQKTFTEPLTPIIKKENNPASEPVSFMPETSLVEGKDIAEATPLPITPPIEDGFAQALGSMLNRDPVVTQYHPEKKENKRLEPLFTEMAVIQGGDFMRGSNEGNRDESPRHRIYIDSFALDIHPVTNEQFVRFLEYMGGEKDQNYNDLIRLKDSRINRSGGKLSIESGYSKHPVVGVTWYGAYAYAKWIGKRLPTEAEWEVACRGGLEKALFPTGDSIEKSHANYFSSDTTAVMSYSPNGYGLYDIVGNVYEWCQDWYGYNYYEASMQEPNNPKGPPQGVYRVLRGGCWKSLKDDLRCSYRHRNNPGTVNSTYGFRCAADVQ